MGTQKIWLAMVCERKGWEESQSFEKKKYGNHFLSSLI
jgi:hypothetical protein